jgi:hypothetical protein
VISRYGFPEWTHYANALLPLDGKDRRRTAEDLIAHRMKFQKTPTFDGLNTYEFWDTQFQGLRMVDLVNKCRALGVKPGTPMNKASVRTQLATYFILRVENMSRGN